MHCIVLYCLKCFEIEVVASNEERLVTGYLRSVINRFRWYLNIVATDVFVQLHSFQLVVARLDGCLDFLRLGGPPGSTHLTPQASENSPVNRSSPRAKRKNNPDSGVSATEHAPASAIVCRLIQKVRAHLKPVSLLRVLPGRVITGSQDRTLKVHTAF